MTRSRVLAAVVAGVLTVVTALGAQRAASPRELSDAEHDVPQLAEVLELKPGMTVADVGAGFGAMTIVFSRWLGPSGRVLASDIGATQLTVLRDAVTRERLGNVTVIESAAAATNLPDACCDAIFMRDVYHHITEPEAFNRSLAAALRPGGRLAVIDFEPRKGSRVPAGVNPNRGGHGIPPSVVEREVVAAGLRFDKTIARWPPDAKEGDFFLVLLRKP